VSSDRSDTGIVGHVYCGPWLFGRRNVALELLRQGLATASHAGLTGLSIQNQVHATGEELNDRPGHTNQTQSASDDVTEGPAHPNQNQGAAAWFRDDRAYLKRCVAAEDYARRRQRGVWEETENPRLRMREAGERLVEWLRRRLGR
jgi:endonuclease YncB( thermonuclease family)